MTNNPTERQPLMTAIRKLQSIVNQGGKAVVAALLISLASCASDGGPRAYRSPSDALEDYASCLSRLGEVDTVATGELIALTRDWLTLDSTINELFIAAPDSSAHTGYIELRQQIVGRLCQLAASRERTLNDYLDVTEQLNKFERDTTDCGEEEWTFPATVHEAYAMADSIPTFGIDAKRTIASYERVLDGAILDGFADRYALLRFLVAEDVAFRSFLVHLPGYGGIPLEAVRDKTVKLQRQILEMAVADSATLLQSEAVTILRIRNNRRLILNAQACAEDILGGEVAMPKGSVPHYLDDRTAAYLIMLLQPFCSIDALGYSLMDEREREAMRRLADDTPRCLSRLGRDVGLIDLGRLSAELIKDFILEL